MKSPEALVQSSLLRWARGSANLAPEAVATRADVKVEKLLEWESGKSRPSIAQLRKLAEVYRRPLAVFFLSEPPKDFQTIRDYRSIAPDEASSSYALHLEIRHAQERRDAAIELSESLGAKVKAPKLFTCTVEDDPEAVANRLRDLLGVSVPDQVSWRDGGKALRRWKEAVEARSVLVFEMKNVETSEARGFSVFESTYPVIGLNGSEAPTARIFTLGHELTHLLLRSGGICEFFGHVAPQYQTIESFCNRVSAALLMPRESVLAEPDAVRQSNVDLDRITRLARRFSVSSEAMAIRLGEMP